MEGPIRVGLFGAGPWATSVIGPVLASGPETTCTGVWSRDPQKASALAATLHTTPFADPDALIAASDAVAIVVPPAVQPGLARRAVAAGRHLLLEKPLAADLDAARDLAGSIAEAGVGALVTLSHRFNPRLDAFGAAVADLHPTGGRACFVSGAFLAGPYAGGWRLERGAVLDLGPHVLDLLEVALGEIVSVRAAGSPHGWVSLLCEHSSGATSTAAISGASAGPARTEVEVHGPDGTAVYDGQPDFAAWPTRLRRALVTVAAGGAHPASVSRALHLQALVADIEAQL